MTMTPIVAKPDMKTAKISKTKAKLSARLGLATMFAFSIGITPAPSYASQQTAGCKGDDCNKEIQRDIERDAAELAREAEQLATSVAAATRELVEDFVGRIDDVVRSMPQYEQPEVGDNGDIIIRRKPAAAENGADRAI